MLFFNSYTRPYILGLSQFLLKVRNYTGAEALNAEGAKVSQKTQKKYLKPAFFVFPLRHLCVLCVQVTRPPHLSSVATQIQ